MWEQKWSKNTQCHLPLLASSLHCHCQLVVLIVDCHQLFLSLSSSSARAILYSNERIKNKSEEQLKWQLTIAFHPTDHCGSYGCCCCSLPLLFVIVIMIDHRSSCSCSFQIMVMSLLCHPYCCWLLWLLLSTFCSSRTMPPSPLSLSLLMLLYVVASCCHHVCHRDDDSAYS